MLVFGAITIFLLRDIGSGMIFTIIESSAYPAVFHWLFMQCLSYYRGIISQDGYDHARHKFDAIEVMCPSSDHRRFRTWCLSGTGS